MMDATIRGLKPTATLTQSLRDPEETVPLSVSFVEHSDRGHPQKNPYTHIQQGFSIICALELTRMPCRGAGIFRDLTGRGVPEGV